MSGSNPSEPDPTSDAPTRRAAPPIARDAIAGAVEILGGAEALAKWATDNQDKFWTTLFPKLLQLQGTGDDSESVGIAAAIEAARKRAWGNVGSGETSAQPKQEFCEIPALTTALETPCAKVPDGRNGSA